MKPLNKTTIHNLSEVGSKKSNTRLAMNEIADRMFERETGVSELVYKKMTGSFTSAAAIEKKDNN